MFQPISFECSFKAFGQKMSNNLADQKSGYADITLEGEQQYEIRYKSWEWLFSLRRGDTILIGNIKAKVSWNAPFPNKIDFKKFICKMELRLDEGDYFVYSGTNRAQLYPPFRFPLRLIPTVLFRVSAKADVVFFLAVKRWQCFWIALGVVKEINLFGRSGQIMDG